MTVPRQTSVRDERRNTSRVFPVEPGALQNALRALTPPAFRDVLLAMARSAAPVVVPQ